jgi:hypothetical protein
MSLDCILGSIESLCVSIVSVYFALTSVSIYISITSFLQRRECELIPEHFEAAGNYLNMAHRSRSVLRTGGLTNQAHSQASSGQRRFTKMSNSRQASAKNEISDSVIETFGSMSGGGIGSSPPSVPVNPHRPYSLTKACIATGIFEEEMAGTRDHIM